MRHTRTSALLFAFFILCLFPSYAQKKAPGISATATVRLTLIVPESAAVAVYQNLDGTFSAQTNLNLYQDQKRGAILSVEYINDDFPLKDVRPVFADIVSGRFEHSDTVSGGEIQFAAHTIGGPYTPIQRPRPPQTVIFQLDIF